MTYHLREAGQVHLARLAEGQAPETGISLPATPLAPDGVLDMLAGVIGGIRPEFDPCAWMDLDGARIVGLISLVKAPEDASITIGYGIASGEQGKGAASGAVRELLAWAIREPRIRHVRAETSVANRASQIVLERNGFFVVGERHDEEDGELLCWNWSKA